MVTSENDFDDFYHDDPAPQIPKNKLPSKFIATGALILGSVLFFQSTLAGNISLNSGRGIEFGQSVSQAVACSGATNLTLTPRSTFINGSPGAHYLNSVTVSGIPDSCYGVDFTINAYGNTDNSPLALFNSTSTNAVVYNNAGTFSTGIGSSGMTLTGSAGTFTATFTTPVAQSSSVFKLTIQSGAHIRPYFVGNPGPGGGLIYYVDEAGFSCGATYISTGSPTGGLCHYLEAAPSEWNTGSDPGLIWAVSANQSSDVIGLTNDASAYNNPLGVGLGYQNSITIVDAGNNTTTAAGAARAYAGGSKSDWYLPSAAELNLLCQWVNGVSPSVTTTCSGGTLNSNTYGADSAGFNSQYYWSSSEKDSGKVWWQLFSGGEPGGGDRNELLLVRPIRAF